MAFTIQAQVCFLPELLHSVTSFAGCSEVVFCKRETSSLFGG